MKRAWLGTRLRGSTEAKSWGRISTNTVRASEVEPPSGASARISTSSTLLIFAAIVGSVLTERFRGRELPAARTTDTGSMTTGNSGELRAIIFIDDGAVAVVDQQHAHVVCLAGEDDLGLVLDDGVELDDGLDRDGKALDRRELGRSCGRSSSTRRYRPPPGTFSER